MTHEHTPIDSGLDSLHTATLASRDESQGLPSGLKGYPERNQLSAPARTQV